MSPTKTLPIQECQIIGEGPGQPGLVSVVIPTYNRAYIVGAAIASVLRQSYRPVEVVVIDDGSTDDTAAVVSRYGPEVRYFRQKNAGVSAARNHGLREALGEFVALLDSDDEWLDWKIPAQVAILRAFPEVGMVWSDMMAVDQQGAVGDPQYLRKFYSAHSRVRIEEICRRAATLGEIWPAVPVEVAARPIYVGDIFSSMLLGNLVHTSTVLLRRERLRLTGEFDGTFRFSGEDYEFHLRCSSFGPVALLDASSIRYRVGAADQLTAPEWGLEIARNNLVTVRRWLERGKDRIELPDELIRGRLAESYGWVGDQALRAGVQWTAITHLWRSLRLKPDPWIAGRFALSWLPRPVYRLARDLRNRLRRAPYQPGQVLPVAMPVSASVSAALSVRVIESAAELDGIRADWNRLLQQAPTASIFSTPEWLLPWLAAYGGGRKPLIIAFHDESGAMIALAPMALTTRRTAMRQFRMLQLLGDGSGDSDNLEILAVPGCEREVVSSLLDFLTTRYPRWDIASFDTMPADSPTGSALMRELQRRRWSQMVARGSCCAVPLPATWETYLQRISSKEREKIRYWSRRLEKRYRVKYRRCCDPDEIEPRLQQLFELHAKRWQQNGQAGSFAIPERRTFYRLLSSVLLNRNWLEFWVLELDDTPAAAIYGFTYRGCCYSLQEGFDPAFNADSVGYVLRAHILRHLIEAGIQKYDFLGGVTDSKLRWGAVPGEYLFLTFARPLTFGAVYIRTLLAARGAQEFLHSHAPRSLFDILRRAYRWFVPLKG